MRPTPIDPERLIHSTKTAIAVFIGTLIARFFGPPADQWIVITIIVVMCAQIYVGGVLQKSYFRFLGTLIGCLLATLTLLTVGHTHASALITITFSSFVFSYFATGKEALAYTGTLGAVTTAIILLGQSPSLLFAGQRFLEISFGLLIAALVSQFILPIHASKHLIRAQALTLRHLLAYYRQATKQPHRQEPTPSQIELDETITKSLTKQRQLAKESASEVFFGRLHAKKFIEILQYEREMFRAINIMHTALTSLAKNPDVCDCLVNADDFHQPVLESLSIMVSTLESAHAKQPHIHLPSLSALTKTARNCHALTDDESLALDGYLFAMSVLLNSLKKLALLYGIEIRNTLPSPT